MGACCSKTSAITSIPTPPEVKLKPLPEKPKTDSVSIVTTVSDQEAPKKEVFVVKHRKSHEIDRHPDQEIRKSIDRKKNPNSSPNSESSQFSGVGTSTGAAVVGAAVRTSSCTKEEVDAILIQCGRLSRSSSGVKPAGGETPAHGRRYSGSKRSYDFDMEVVSKNDDDDVAAAVGGRQREPRVSSPSSRRRSRERDPQQQRSGSKERGSGNGGRRVSRSPNRRSESPNPNSNSSAGVVGVANRPGKMVSVPATDKGNNAGGGEVASGGAKRIQVKRNGGEAVVVAGSTRTAASPRSRSPARAIRVLNENQNQNQNQQPLTLSRSNSRKAEHSPYRRNPLAEIDTNVAGSEQPSSKKPISEKTMSNKTTNVVVTKNSIVKEQHMIDGAKTTVDNPKHNQIVGRTRSSRLSRDLDINPETLLNPNSNQPSYATLLLEDIQNFHQKNPTPTTTAIAVTTPPPPAFSLPACVSKACSILEAVADLNSATNSIDRQFKKDRVNLGESEKVVNDDLLEPDLVESEKVVNDDLMEPSLHKYVTVRRGGDADTEEQESSGSNSFAGSQQMSWMSSSWDLNSGDSTNCWTSNSRSNGRDTEVQRSGEYPRNGIGRNRVGVHGRSAYSLPNNVTAGST